METVADKYVVECTPDGEYYAYLCNHEQCFAYGERWKTWKPRQKNSTMNSILFSTWRI